MATTLRRTMSGAFAEWWVQIADPSPTCIPSNFESRGKEINCGVRYPYVASLREWIILAPWPLLDGY